MAAEEMLAIDEHVLALSDRTKRARAEAFARGFVEDLAVLAGPQHANAGGRVPARSISTVARRLRAADARAPYDHVITSAGARALRGGRNGPARRRARQHHDRTCEERQRSVRRPSRHGPTVPRARATFPPLMLKVHVEGTEELATTLKALATRGEADFSRVEPIVREILAAVRAEGDAAVHRYAERFDRRRAPSLLLREFAGKEAHSRLPAPARAAMELAAARIRAFHAHQKDAGFAYEEAGVSLGVRVSPITRAGVYAPGGKARYPSSVLMSAIPAQVAGVPEIYLATPLAGDASDDPIYAAAHLSGVTAIVDAGGAQAIAAMAYGTASVPRVDKIVGPGNLFVACAKRFVFGAVDIDSIAGPSEILVVADASADPRVVAADLLSQAEHDEAAYPLLVASSTDIVARVVVELEAQLAVLPREAIARASLTANGHAFVASSRVEMARIADVLAAEHLSLQVDEPRELLKAIPRAGAAFIGHMTPEAAGDYLAGPSHVLPTGGSVRFGSPLGVYDFVTRTSLIQYTEGALRAHGRFIEDFARLEGLEAHARAVAKRLE